MEYLNELEVGIGNISYLGIVMMVPITEWKKEPCMIKTYRCSSCKREESSEPSKINTGTALDPVWTPKKRFCPNCGSEVVEVIEQEKSFRNGKGREIFVPFPDIRNELKELELEYAAFNDDEEDAEERDAEWRILLKEYTRFSLEDLHGGPQEASEIDLEQVQKDIKEQSEKYSAFIKKYNAKVFFGTTTDYCDY